MAPGHAAVSIMKAGVLPKSRQGREFIGPNNFLFQALGVKRFCLDISILTRMNQFGSQLSKIKYGG